ncbi:MAG: hypothetical protein GY927_07670 [bacterium]|nr:hypothetical protein [bacterium]
MADKSIARGEIHLSELIRALKELPWRNADQLNAIAASLGFGIPPDQPEEQTPAIYDRSRYPSRPEAPSTKRHQPKFSAPTAAEPPVELPKRMIPSQLNKLGRQAPAAPEEPDWLDDDFRILNTEEAPTLYRQPLFGDNTSRGIFTAALATQRQGQEVDVDALIDRIVRGQRIDRLAYLPTATLELGCQLLLDYSDTMIPYWEDLNGLIEQVSVLLGSANVEIFNFSSNPSQARRWATDNAWQDWAPQGCPVLGATDFGIQGQNQAATGEEWKKFIRSCCDAKVPLLLLIPWPRKHWPSDLGAYPELIHWSPHTTAGMIRQKLGLGHQVGS